MERLKIFLMNPFTLYLKWLFMKIRIETKYRKAKLRCGYMTEIRNCEFSYRNTIDEYSKLFDSSLGDFTYIASQTVINNAIIGKYCSIGAYVKVGLGIHPTHFVSTHPMFYSQSKQSQITYANQKYYEETKQTIIGNDVWIGAGAILKDGINIGHGAIIASGAVVTRDINPYEIVGGVPAKTIRYRFDDETISKLLKKEWWNKDQEWIKENAMFFRNIELFCKI